MWHENPFFLHLIKKSKGETIYDFFHSNTQVYGHWGLRKRRPYKSICIVPKMVNIGCGTRIENLSIWYILHDRYTN